MNEGLHRVRAFLVALATPDSEVPVAWSGGADSTAAAWLVRQAGFPVILLHVDHGLRPEDQVAERAWLEEHAPAVGVLRVLPVAVDPAVRRGAGEEAAARDARHGALATACRDLGAGGYVLGHTLDDQAETVLLRLLRGTGIDGLGAMAPEGQSPADPAVRVIRPLLVLGLGRGDAQDVCRDAGLAWWEDPSNESGRYLRNRVRREVLPLLAELNPGIVRHLAAVAEDARALADRSGPWEDAVVAACAVAGGFSLPPLGPGEGAIVRAALVRLGVPADRDLVGRLTGLATGRRLGMPGGAEAWRTRDRLELRGAFPPAPPVDLDRAGTVAWGDWVLTGTTGTAPAEGFVAAPLRGHLSVRAWQPGDRLGPAGALVKDGFDRAGIDRWTRRRWPVVTRDGVPWWVPGVLGPVPDTGEPGPEPGRPVRWLVASRNGKGLPNV